MGSTAVADLANRSGSTTRPPRERKVGRRNTETSLSLLQQEALEKSAPSAIAALEGRGHVVELDPDKVVFDSDVNQRIQEWLHESNPSYRKLKDSIRAQGQIDPILVSAIREDGTYRGYYGSRRRHITHALGFKVKAIISEEVLTEEEANRVAILENYSQEPLSEYEEALSVQRHQTLHPDASLSEISEFFGKNSKSWASRQLEFAKIDSRFIQCTADPWNMKEWPLRDVLNGWNTLKARKRFEKILDEMLLSNEQLRFKELIKKLIPEPPKKKPSIQYNKERVPVITVSPPKKKRGRFYRSIEICTESNQGDVERLIAQLIDNPESDVMF